MGSDTGFETIKDQFSRSCDEMHVPKQHKDEVINFILQQFNDASLMGYINVQQYHEILTKIEPAIYIMIYVNQYTPGERLIHKRPFFVAATNYMRFLLSRILHGRDRGTKELEIRSRQPITISQK